MNISTCGKRGSSRLSSSTAVGNKESVTCSRKIVFISYKATLEIAGDLAGDLADDLEKKPGGAILATVIHIADIKKFSLKTK